MLEQKILNIKTQAFAAFKEARSAEELFNLRVKYLGRKSELNEVLKSLKNLTIEERRKIGQLANTVKREIEVDYKEAEKLLKSRVFNLDLEKIDVTIPGKRIKRGHLHPLTIIQNEIEDIFTSMGFEIVEGPEVETEWYNFDALNIPADHPARDEWDTFWLKARTNADFTRTSADKSLRGSVLSQYKSVLLRTHTSPVQIRYMQENKPPFRIIVPGKCFRHEATDAAHEHTFYQFEALMVGDDISIGHLKFIAREFFSRFFKKDIKVRLRPSFFPFTEPSFEFDISCTVCNGKGCPSCKNGGWLEMGGAGMVNQAVFVASGYPRNNPARNATHSVAGGYQGLAWGFGLERLAMMKYKIDDIRLFHSGDLRFIKQF